MALIEFRPIFLDTVFTGFNILYEGQGTNLKIPYFSIFFGSSNKDNCIIKIPYPEKKHEFKQCLNAFYRRAGVFLRFSVFFFQREKRQKKREFSLRFLIFKMRLNMFKKNIIFKNFKN